MDAICFGRSDLAESLQEGMPIDVVARLSSRAFGGFESLQLDVRDVAPAGLLQSLARAAADGTSQAAVPAPSVNPSEPVVSIPIFGEPTPLAVTG